MRIAAIEKLTDQALLADFAKNDSANGVRMVAIGKLTDHALRADFAKNDSADDIRMAAVRCLADQILLADVAKNSTYSDVRIAAIGNLTDQALLADFAKNDSADDVRMAAEQRLGDCKRMSERPLVVQKALNDLLALFQSIPALGNTREQDRQPVRKIGELLDEYYGMSGMREVGMAFAAKMPQHARRLETMWDGIGNWRG
jgi:glyceraldehyde-3-phosphate dehydrogenase/erythrose-4-phosphate dehydrogenase